MATSGSIWGKPVFCVITGASQHIGRVFAERFVRKLGDGSVLLLTSRSKERLQEVEKSITNVNPKVKVGSLVWDFRKPDPAKYEADLSKFYADSKVKFEAAVIIHNAAALGDMGRRIIHMNDTQELREQLDVNVVSMLTLNSVFLKLAQDVPEKIVINMTAPSASKARKSFGLTAMCKSSRQILLSILALEEPHIRVLHYDPGAVDTDSLRACRDESYDEEIRTWIKGFYDRGEILTGEQVADGLVGVLERNNFKSGDCISAYDLQN
jgi:sepiapterin reductase